MRTCLEIQISDPCLVLLAIHLFILCRLPVLGTVVGARTLGTLARLCPGALSHYSEGWRGESAQMPPLCAQLTPHSL